MDEPALSFDDLLAYTDYLAGRWMKYFRLNPKALDIEVGGRMPALRDLVAHIFQVEALLLESAIVRRHDSDGPPGADRG